MKSIVWIGMGIAFVAGMPIWVVLTETSLGYGIGIMWGYLGWWLLVMKILLDAEKGD